MNTLTNLSSMSLIARTIQPVIPNIYRSVVKHPKATSLIVFSAIGLKVFYNLYAENIQLKQNYKFVQTQCSNFTSQIDSLKRTVVSKDLDIKDMLEHARKHQLQIENNELALRRQIFKLTVLKNLQNRKTRSTIYLFMVSLYYTSKAVAYRNHLLGVLDERMLRAEDQVAVVTKARDKLYQRTLDLKNEIDKMTPKTKISQVLASRQFRPPTDPKSVSKPTSIGLVLSAATLYKLSIRALRDQGKPAPTESCIMAEIAFWKSQSAIPNSWSDIEVPEGVIEKYNQELAKFAQRKQERKITHTNGTVTHVSGHCPEHPLSSLPVKVVNKKIKSKTEVIKPDIELISLNDDAAQKMDDLMIMAKERETELSSICIAPEPKREPLTKEQVSQYQGDSDFTSGTP